MDRGRFAPTPSGALHLGSARTAVASALAARSTGGRWVLRVEDLDAARTPTGATAAMIDDLCWLGLDWDEGPGLEGPHGPYLQSQRRGLYIAALDTLIAAGRVYPCSCTRRDVEQAAQAPHGAEPVYPGTCRERDPAEVIGEARARGRGVSWRFKVVAEHSLVRFDDLIVGPCMQDVAKEVGDFVVFRSDGVPAYQLAVVVDDVAMEITEVLRGDDLLASTARQVLLYNALDAPSPRWVHIPLVLADDGERLAKRLGSMALRHLRNAGASPSKLLTELVATLGVPTPDGSLRILAQSFRLEDIPREAVRWRPGGEMGSFVT